MVRVQPSSSKPTTIQAPRRSLRARPGRASNLITELPPLRDINNVLDPEPPKRKREVSPDPKEENHTVKRSKSGNGPNTTMLDLPSEIIQEIGFLLPYASDAIPLMYTCRQFYNILDSHFWFRRRRIYQGFGSGDVLNGVVKRDMTERYNQKKDYRVEILKAFHGSTGGRTVRVKGTVEKEAGESEKTEGEEKPIPQEKGAKDDILRCQMCLINRAYKYWHEIELIVCPRCRADNRIRLSELSFLKQPQLDKCRIIYENTKFSRIPYIWRPDIEKQMRKAPALYNNKSLQELIDEHVKAEEASQVATAKYQGEICEKLKDYYRKHWAQPKYDKFREVFGDLEGAIKLSAERCTESISRSSGDRKERWYRSKLSELFGRLFDDSKFSYAQIELRRMLLDFHNRRLTEKYNDALPPLQSGMDSTIGAVCKFCYEDVAAKRSTMDRQAIEEEELKVRHYIFQRQEEWDRWICGYKTVGSLVEHHLENHLHVMLSRENNESGEWFSFLEGVQGNDPVRRDSLAIQSGSEKFPDVRMPPPGVSSQCQSLEEAPRTDVHTMEIEDGGVEDPLDALSAEERGDALLVEHLNFA